MISGQQSSPIVQIGQVAVWGQTVELNACEKILESQDLFWVLYMCYPLIR